MNVYATDHRHHKRKQSRNKTRKFYNTREGSESSRPTQRSLKLGPQTVSSNVSGCEVCTARGSDGNEDSDSNAPLFKNVGGYSRQSGLHEPQRKAVINEVHVQKSPTLSSSIDPVDESESPAVSALRSLSFQVPKRSNSQGLQRVSTVLSNTLNVFRPAPAVSFVAVPSHNASKKAQEISRKSSAHSKSLAYRDTNCRHPTFKDGKDGSQTLGTPATITLRKASNIYTNSPISTSMSASLSHEGEQTRPADAPASELLAFYSSSTFGKAPALADARFPESAGAHTSLRKQPAIMFDSEPQFLRRDSKSVSQINDISNARRYSIPAEAALTFADVHVAPGSFTIGAKSGEQSLVNGEFSRRISTVLFQSRNSVHEIIWREDETTSDSSLTTSSKTSQHAGHSFRSTPTPESEGSPTREQGIEPKKKKKALLPMISESASIFTKRPDNLFRWTWASSSASTEATTADPESDTPSQVAETRALEVDSKGDPVGQVQVNSTSDPDLVSLQSLSDQRCSRLQKPSHSELPSVQSFRSLCPHSSTTEGRRADQVRKNAHSSRLGAGVGSSTTGAKGALQLHERRRGSVAYVYARLGLVGSVGSQIGASSRKRVLSVQRSTNRA